jgi:aryl-alcohol dehydrogenase-like predicted oxidoreductase
VDQSLKRLKTDHLDLVQFHASPSKAQLEEHSGLSALKDLQKQGKVRFIGMSGTLPNLPEQIDMGAFDVFQVPYSALQREHEDLMTRAAETGAGIVVRGGAARGGPSKQEGNFWDAWQKMEIDDLLDGMSPMEFIVRFTVSHPAMSTTIIGTLNTDHLLDNANAIAKGPLPADLYSEAKRRLLAAGSAPLA